MIMLTIYRYIYHIHRDIKTPATTALIWSIQASKFTAESLQIVFQHFMRFNFHTLYAVILNLDSLYEPFSFSSSSCQLLWREQIFCQLWHLLLCSAASSSAHRHTLNETTKFSSGSWSLSFELLMPPLSGNFKSLHCSNIASWLQLELLAPFGTAGSMSVSKSKTHYRNYFYLVVLY